MSELIRRIDSWVEAMEPPSSCIKLLRECKAALQAKDSEIKQLNIAVHDIDHELTELRIQMESEKPDIPLEDYEQSYWLSMPNGDVFQYERVGRQVTITFQNDEGADRYLTQLHDLSKDTRPVKGSLEWAKAQDGRVRHRGWTAEKWMNFITNEHEINAVHPKTLAGWDLDTYKKGWSKWQEPELEDGVYWVSYRGVTQEMPYLWADAEWQHPDGDGGYFSIKADKFEVLRNPDGTPMKIEIPGGE